MADQQVPTTLSNNAAGDSQGLTLQGLPNVYILPTRLNLEELHATEEKLAKYRASLTYDVNEARLILGKVAQKKRASFELRGQGLWTEEIVNGTQEPPAKKRRVGTPERKSQSQTIHASLIATPEKTPRKRQYEVIVVHESTTASESEDDAGLKPSDIVKGQRPFSPRSQPTPPADDPPAFAAEDFKDRVKVVRLDWLDSTIQAGHLLPLEPYLVYEGRPISKPKDASLQPESSSTFKRVEPEGKTKPKGVSTPKAEDLQAIIERAKGDAASRSTGGYVPAKVAYKKEFKDRAFMHSTQSHPPKLQHMTTSEYDEGASSELPEMPDWVKENKFYSCERSTPSPSPNEAFIDKLKKIKLARLLTADAIGVRAYSTSIASVAAYPYQLTSPREILALPGCDAKIANLFVEFKNSNGNIKAVQEIEDDSTLTILRSFYDIWGVGDTTARDFYYSRHWKDLDDIVEFGWDSIQRVQQIGVKYYNEFLSPIPRPEVEQIASVVHNYAKQVRDDGVECIIVGGYRRGKKESGDVDMILSHRNEEVTANLVKDVTDALDTAGWVTHTLTLNLTSTHRGQQTLPFQTGGGGHGFDTLDKALVVWQDPTYDTSKHKKNPNIHRRVDIIVCPWRTVGCAIVGWSGGTTFQRDLRMYARKVKGWKFDSSGIRDRATGKVVDVEGVGGVSPNWEESEKRVFRGLGLTYREPWERCTG